MEGNVALDIYWKHKQAFANEFAVCCWNPISTASQWQKRMLLWFKRKTTKNVKAKVANEAMRSLLFTHNVHCDRITSPT